MLVTSAGKMTCGAYGPSPDRFATILRAELRAVIQLLAINYGLLPLRVGVDNQGVVTGRTGGRVWCCALFQARRWCGARRWQSSGGGSSGAALRVARRWQWRCVPTRTVSTNINK